VKIKKSLASFIILALSLGLFIVFMPMMYAPFVSIEFKLMVVFLSILLVAVFSKVLIFSIRNDKDSTENDDAQEF